MHSITLLSNAAACFVCLRRYYSLFTLGMLIMFECTVVVQRQRNLRELRSLQTPKQRLQAYRAGKWEVRRSDAIN
jgi:cation-transporting ATPase 13A1